MTYIFKTQKVKITDDWFIAFQTDNKGFYRKKIRK